MADIKATSLGGVPKGTTSQRPTSPSIGDVFYNGTLGCLEIYTSQGWVANSAPPAVPTINSVSQSNSASTYAATSSASIAFTPGSGGGLPNYYTVTSSPGGITQTGSSSPITVSGLTNGTSYTFSITATNNFNTSNSFTSSTLTPSTKPQTPTIGVATAGNAQAVVTYTAGNTGGLATTYTVTSSPGNITATGSSPVTVTGLTNGTAYTFTVTATNANGDSATSSASNSVTPLSPSADLLVVAGGGSGGGELGGGGGAGGYRSVLSQNLAYGTTYTITVGAGGASVYGGASLGNKGVNSSISASGFSTITATGGGGGGPNTTPSTGSGTIGGSGGGSGEGSTRAAGNEGGYSPVEGYAGGAAYDPANYGSGGGGGAGAVGSDGSSLSGGNGGIGKSNSITGTAIYYAGGGGGAIMNASGVSVGIGGQGGGGSGGSYNNVITQTSGTANTGGGGGGQGGNNSSYPSGAGGSGVVILRSNVTAISTTGSPTVTTDGAYKVYKFTVSGSITF